MKNNLKDSSDYISPLKLDGLDGRMLCLPAKNANKAANNILFIYGHHSSLERWWGLIKVLSNYGNVIVPDLPGFGGMDSLYKVGKKPTIDNLADYLASFIDSYYKDKKLSIAGMSFGFVIATRMLQRHPEISKKVTLLVSIVGFANKDDFTFSKSRYEAYLLLSKLFSHRPFSTFFRYVILNPLVLHIVYARTHNARHKFKQASTKAEFNHLMDIEVGLWQDNEIRTYMFTTSQFLTLDNCKIPVDLPVWHVSAKADHFFDNSLVEKHMRIIFSDFQSFMTTMTTHAPSVIADEETASNYIPEKLHLLLNKI